MIELNELQGMLRQGRIPEVIQLVEADSTLVNHLFERHSKRVSLLELAVERNATELVRLLLDRGADPFADGCAKNHLLSVFLESSNFNGAPSTEILKLLMDHGADFEATDSDSCQKWVLYKLHRVYSNDFAGTLKALIKHGFDPAAVERLADTSMLTRALEHRYDKSCKVADILLSQGCSANAVGKDYTSPLEKALGRHLYGFAAKLVQHGADVSRIENVTHTVARHPEMPAELRDELIKGHDLGLVSRDGRTPLHAAVEGDDIQYAIYLVEHGVDINQKGRFETPLLHAVEWGRKNMIKHLVKLGADLNAKNRKGETALDLSLARPGFKKVCDVLVQAGAKTSAELAGKRNDAGSSIKKAIQPGETWAGAAREALLKLDNEQASRWYTLIRQCLDNNSSKPSQKWLAEANVVVEQIGPQQVKAYLLNWFPLIKSKRVDNVARDDDDEDYYYRDTTYVISENNTRLLRGLIWIASRYVDSEMSRTLRDLAAQMYKKVYGVGMRNAKLANAALYSLSIMPGTTGLKEIIVLRAATKYNPALVNINRVFGKLAEASGKTPDELAELSTPDYGLTEVGEFRQMLGDTEAIVKLVSVGKCELTWEGQGKAFKSPPAAVKKGYADELKALKGLVKDVQTGSSAHSQRLEQMYLRRKSLDYETWKEQYIDHKLVGFMARRLIWRFTKKTSIVDLIFTINGFVRNDGELTETPANATISLWHPSMSPPRDVLAWRRFLIENEVTQPFKQAHREIYLLTEAERTTKNHSLRFASHILKHSQFHALATQRGWQQQRGGYWDGGNENSAFKSLPAYRTGARFDAEGTEAYGSIESGIYACVATGPVTFSSAQRQIDLEDVDPLVFSEVMRDVDLFVGVTSIGNDPNWRDREDTYWTQSSFGDLEQTAITRKEVLSALVPKLKIAEKLKIEGRFLIVEGKLTTYKIHLGSSNILMAPNDSYLCIVATSSKSTITLPFEGDHILSLILSKAAMLVNDDKITDTTITSQIERSAA